jgi:hypothetical protein
MSALSRLAYRSRQFWNAVFTPPRQVPGELLAPHLTPALCELFWQMQPSEQAHALKVMQRLQAAGQTDPDLLAAALLHDVGKSLAPLSVWERVGIVLFKRFRFGFEKDGRRPGGRGLRRALRVAAGHPAWGADLAAEAGAGERTVELIRRHQDSFTSRPGSPLDELLRALQSADDEN